MFVAVGQDIGNGPSIMSWAGSSTPSIVSPVPSWFAQDLTRVTVVPEDCSFGCTLFASTGNPLYAPQYFNPNNAGNVAPGFTINSGNPGGGIITLAIPAASAGNALPASATFNLTLSGMFPVDVCAPNARIPFADVGANGVPPAPVFNLGNYVVGKAVGRKMLRSE